MPTYGEFDDALRKSEFTDHSAYIRFDYSEEESGNELQATDTITLDGSFTLVDLEFIVAAWKGDADR